MGVTFAENRNELLNLLKLGIEGSQLERKQIDNERASDKTAFMRMRDIPYH